jgi:hypothetical protein
MYVLAFLSINEYFSNRTYGPPYSYNYRRGPQRTVDFSKNFNDDAPQISLIAILFGSSPIFISAFTMV